MKKRTSLLKGFVTCCVLCAIMVSTLGCSKEEPKGEPIEESVVNVEEPEIVVTGDRKITPLNIDINLDDIENCMFNASFKKENVYVNDDGQMVAELTIYDYEQFDMVDIANLKSGDTIVLQGTEIAVETIEVDDLGVVYINGGLENGGHWLKTDDSGIYYEIIENDHKKFHAIGQLYLLVSDEFVFIDNSDLDNPGLEYTFEDIMNDDTLFLYGFSEYSTVIRIADGKLVEIVREYMP